MEPELALTCYNIKIAPLTSETGKDATRGPSALGRHVALRAASFPLFLSQGYNFVP